MEFRKFFNVQKDNHPKSFAEIEKKTQYEARTTIESETSTLAPGDVLNKSLNLQNVDMGTFTKRLSIMSK